MVIDSGLQTVQLASTAEAPGVYTGPLGAGYEQHLAYSFRFTVPGRSATYVALVDAQTLEPLTVSRGEMRLIAAATIGATRLIDNLAV